MSTAARTPGTSSGRARAGISQRHPSPRPRPPDLSTVGPERAAIYGRGVIDVAKSSGLPRWLGLDHQELVLKQPLQLLRPAVRPLHALGRVLLDPGAREPEVICRVFPKAALHVDRTVLPEAGPRPGAVLICPGRASAFVHRPARFHWLLQGAPAWVGVC